MEKNDKYSFRINDEVKHRFKVYCKIMNISPSDILCEVVMNFNDDVEKIIAMKSADELRALLQGKFTRAEREIHQLLEEKKNQQ